MSNNTPSTVLFKIENQVAFLTLNRPEKYNSFNREMAFELQKQLQICEQDNDIRCVVISGSGKGFCAGQDLTEASDIETVDFAKILEEHYNPIILLIRNMNKPVIAMVNGVAAGAGANIALACDIIVAAESATFIQAFSKIGLIPDSGGTYFLPRYIGIQKAMALMMTADKITASEAQDMGMIYKYFADDIFIAETHKMANQLAIMPTQALAMIKKALYEGQTNSLEQQLDLEKELQVLAGRTDDFKEGVTAFIEKRIPIFKGC